MTVSEESCFDTFSSNQLANSQYSQSTRVLQALNMPLKIIQKNGRVQILILIFFAILLEKAECEECDTDVNTMGGYGKSPNYPAEHPNSSDCFWRFESTPGTRIKLGFDSFDLEPRENCDSDYVALFDGNSTDDIPLGRFCGSEIPPSILSTTNKMLMVFHWDSSNTKQGFEFRHWTQSTHFVTSNKSEVTSPSRIGERIWNFEATPGKRIVIVFDYFIMQHELNCSKGYVALYDGQSTNDTLLGKFCGIEEPPPVISTAHKMLMIFHSYDLKEYGGYALIFYATYATECDLAVKTVGGYGKSPNYPAEYPNSSDCFWRFESTPGTRIKLGFDSFDLEPDENCDSDYVALYDGNSADDILLGKFCGSEIPPSILSTTNRMLMVFHSDSSNTKRGFKFRHWTQSTHFVTSNKGIVTSPIYRQRQRMAERIWNFETTPGKRIVIVFDYVEMDELNCTKDYVAIYDGESTNDTLLGQFCGVEKPPPVISTAQKALMIFHSHDFRKYILSSSRFHGTYATECDIIINSTGGYGKSPNYPAEYPNSSDCFWRFESPPETRIKLDFDSFDLEPRENCDSDYVALYDGKSADDILLGRFCGSEIPPSIISTTNRMLMVFHSDSSITKRGFIFRHWTQSTHFVTSNKGIVTSPNYPDHNPRRVERIWNFETTPGNRIVVMFDYFWIRSNEKCARDYVALHDGESENGTLLGRFCGTEKPPPIISTAHKMLMIFHFDDHSHYPGESFNATYATEFNGKAIVSEEVEKILIELLLKTRQDTSTISKWGDDITLTTVALFLHDPQFFAAGNKTGQEIVYELTLQLMSKLVMKKQISTDELALFINAMTVICINPRRFFGFNMVSELRKRLDDEKRTNPFVILTLCNAGENMTMKDVRKLQSFFSAHLQPSWTEMQAMTVMALTCISRQSHINLDTTLTEMVLVLKKKQQNNGRIENLKNTALVIQALIATESHQADFKLKRAMKSILIDLKDKHVGTEEIYYILPIVRWKSFLDINSNHCANFIKTGPVDIQGNGLISSFCGTDLHYGPILRKPFLRSQILLPQLFPMT